MRCGGHIGHSEWFGDSAITILHQPLHKNQAAGFIGLGTTAFFTALIFPHQTYMNVNTIIWETGKIQGRANTLHGMTDRSTQPTSPGNREYRPNLTGYVPK